MSEITELILALVAGIVLGIMFFGGLWLTVKKGLQSKNSGLIFIVSLAIRMTIMLVSFYYIVQYGWKNVLACLVGFLIARVIIVRLTGKLPQSSVDLIKETQHET